MSVLYKATYDDKKADFNPNHAGKSLAPEQYQEFIDEIFKLYCEAKII